MIEDRLLGGDACRPSLFYAAARNGTCHTSSSPARDASLRSSSACLSLG